MIKIKNKEGIEFIAIKIGNSKNTPYILYPNMFELRDYKNEFSEIESFNRGKFGGILKASIQNFKMMIERCSSLSIPSMKDCVDNMINSDNPKSNNFTLFFTKYSFIMLGMACDKDIDRTDIINNRDKLMNDVDMFFNRISKTYDNVSKMNNNFEDSFSFAINVVKYSQLTEDAISIATKYAERFRKDR